MDKDMAKANPNSTPVDVKELIFRVFKGTKLMNGGCNMCVDRDSYEVVNVVEMRSLSFRLCDKCRKNLKEML